MNKRDVAKSVAIWLVTLLLVVLFALQGFRKFPGDTGWAGAFRLWGLPDWFRYTAGILELSAAALLLWRRTAAYGGLLVVAIMLGAIGTLMLNDAMRGAPTAFVAMLLGAVVAWVRRRDALAPFSKSRASSAPPDTRRPTTEQAA